MYTITKLTVATVRITILIIICVLIPRVLMSLCFDFEHFIEDIRKCPEIYLKSHKFYMDTKKKVKIWDDLSKKHNVDGK